MGGESPVVLRKTECVVCAALFVASKPLLSRELRTFIYESYCVGIVFFSFGSDRLFGRRKRNYGLRLRLRF